MERSQTISKRLAWSIIGVAVVVFVLISVILYVLFGTKPDASNTGTKTEISSSSESIATEEEIRSDIDTLEEALRGAKDDRDDAKKSAKDSNNQIPLSE